MLAQNSDDNNTLGSDQDSSYDDKRYIPRWEVNNRILLQTEEDNNVRECRSRDISCVGICLSTPQELSVNQKVRLTVYLSEATQIQVIGTILWTKKTTDGNLVGIIFEDTKPETQDLILDYAFEIKREDLVKHWFRGWGENA